MPIHFRNRYALNYKEIVKSKFKYLIDYFGYEPGDIFVEVLPLEKFDSFYKLEKGIKPIPFIVGTALSNGRILVLDKKDFSKKQGHNEEEFEEV
ncbi:MAG: hypothetical protein HQ541_15405, partial [Mariniphaga sp.]|nr:hypothetical protein [Mariniphaga sp.]